MRRRKYNLSGSAVVGLLSLLISVWTATLHAGDEDMSPSAYHVFDPETGYMITVDPQAEEQTTATVDDESTDATLPLPWLLLVVVIVIASGIYFLRLKKRDAHS